LPYHILGDRYSGTTETYDKNSFSVELAHTVLPLDN
jgi:hypothetical protein